MCAKKPVIKFSPFEALLIGEKNRILKRQPTKNTIFVSRLNQRSKIVNLRDLFGLEKSTKTENNDVIFKVPQRVCDFLKNRRIQRQNNKSPKSENDEILCYEFEGCKVLCKNYETIPKDKNMKIKPNKVKFKRKFNCPDFSDKVVKKFPDPNTKTNYKPECKSITLKCMNRKLHRHLLRGKDGKFISKLEYKSLTFECLKFKNSHYSLRGKDGKFVSKVEYKKSKSKEISPRQKYLSNYLHQLYLKRNKELLDTSEISIEDSSKLEMPLSVECVIGLPHLQFDISAPETLLNEVSLKYYENSCYEDFQFPKFRDKLEPADFEDDSNLIDIIYENFPKIVRFESQSQLSDFSEALLASEILESEKNLEMREKKNEFIKAQEFREILSQSISLINLNRINDIIPIIGEGNLYVPKIDEPYTERSHLISGKSFGSLFFQSAEGKEIFIGNLMKPILENWFGSLPKS